MHGFASVGYYLSKIICLKQNRVGNYSYELNLNQRNILNILQMKTRGKVAAKPIAAQEKPQKKTKKSLNKSFVQDRSDYNRPNTKSKNHSLNKSFRQKAKENQTQNSQSECLTDDQIDIDFNVPCREDQQTQLLNFLTKTMIGKGNSNTIYVSGVPGVGKTTTVLKTLQKFKRQNHNVNYHYVNGLKLKKPFDIYDVLLKELIESEKIVKGKTKKSQLVEELQKIIKKLKKNHYFVIDEVDFLMTKDQSIYYNIFDWSFNNKKFSIIAIGNTLDFPKKLDDKIGSRMGHNNLIFKPYTQKQILHIVKELVSKPDLYQKDAMIYASKKMVTFTSDIRKITEVLRRAQEERKDGKIKIEHISNLWEEVRGNTEIEENMPKVYRQIVQIIKQKGGKANQLQIQQKLRLKEIKLISNQVVYALKEMEQMGLLNYSYEIVKHQQMAVAAVKKTN